VAFCHLTWLGGVAETGAAFATITALWPESRRGNPNVKDFVCIPGWNFPAGSAV